MAAAIMASMTAFDRPLIDAVGMPIRIGSSYGEEPCYACAGEASIWNALVVMTDVSHDHRIELRIDKIAQIFHTLDPFPFRERDLDREAEDYIVGWAGELSTDRALRIVIHLPEIEAKTRAAQELGAAFDRYFADRAHSVQREIKELFRVGRRSLGIGITVLVTCLALAHVVGGYLTSSPFGRLVEESFLLLGWVANWRPLEIFLYDWVPLARRRDLYRRLSAAMVDLQPYADAETARQH